MNQYERTELLDRYLAGKTTRQEDEVVEKWLTELQPVNNEWLNKSATEKKEYVSQLFKEIEHAIKPRSKVVKMKRKVWMAAAVSFFVLVAGTWFLIINNNDRHSTEVVQQKTEDDILPGGNKAVLTLADGTRVILDATDTGAISEQGGVTVIKLDDGELSYQKNKSANEAVVYNTISTPRGGQYQLTLSDGTKVWLNAESSLRYPTAFAGNDRKVELTGEGYFEVAHNVSKPFYVTVGEMDVKVLGTHFNVDAYGDEEDIRTTLLEGAVAVSFNSQKVTLKPGQQAQLEFKSQRLNNIGYVNTDMAVAWKNGKLLFKEASIETIMKTAVRWYNADVVYEGKINATFSGGISRSDNISQLLKILKATDKVSFTVKNNKVIVRPPTN